MIEILIVDVKDVELGIYNEEDAERRYFATYGESDAFVELYNKTHKRSKALHS
jgi:hypothetical protein